MLRAILTVIAIVTATATTAATKEVHANNLHLFSVVSQYTQTDINNNTGDCATGTVVGLYDIAQNIMVICDGLSYDMFYETLRHEAVHLAQDCKQGLGNHHAKAISEPNAIVAHTKGYVADMLSNYNTNDIHVLLQEAEAFILESRDSKFIADVVEHACKGQ